MAKDSILLRQPRDLVERAEDQWDRLTTIPQFREIGPRKSGAAAMRLLELLGMDALDKQETLRNVQPTNQPTDQPVEHAAAQVK